MSHSACTPVDEPEEKSEEKSEKSENNSGKRPRKGKVCLMNCKENWSMDIFKMKAIERSVQKTRQKKTFFQGTRQKKKRTGTPRKQLRVRMLSIGVLSPLRCAWPLWCVPNVPLKPCWQGSPPPPFEFQRFNFIYFNWACAGCAQIRI